MHAATKMKTHTYSEIANDYALWSEYVDTAGMDTRERFDSMTQAEKVAIQEDCFGLESAARHDCYANRTL